MKAKSKLAWKRSDCPVFSILKTILLLLPFSVSFQMNAQTYFFDDFNNGLGNFTTYDLDGMVPAPNISQYFGTTAPFKAWTRLSLDGNSFALSTSWYIPAGTSNDWLVTKSPINIQSSSAVLTWKGRAFDPDYRDGYKVRISTTGNKVTDFTTISQTVSAENSSWTTRSINLGGYVGQNIYIAFVNTSTDKYLLSIDDVFVGVTAFSIVDNTSQYTYNKSVAVGGVLENMGRVITEFSASYTALGKTYTKNFTGLNIAPGSTFTYVFTDSITVNGAGNVVPYSLEVSSGTITRSVTGSVSLASFKPFKKVVVEEGTGTWCGWCPRGFVAMKNLKTEFNETFIGIAVHNAGINVQYPDPMTDPVYDAGLGALLSGYPQGAIDRKYISGTDDFRANLLNARKDFVPADFSLSADWGDALQKSIKLKTEIIFNTHYNGTAGYKMAFVVIENNVKGITPGYNQRNYYVNNKYGPMDGWETLPDPVPAAQMIYPDVARKIYNSFTGINNSIPATLTMNQNYKFDYIIELPQTVINMKETEIIALLVDTISGHIMNARKIAYKDIPVGLETFEKPGVSAKIRKNMSHIILDVETTNQGPISAELYNIEGKRFFQASVSNEKGYTFKMPYAGFRGVYIIRVITNEGTFNRKIVLE